MVAERAALDVIERVQRGLMAFMLSCAAIPSNGLAVISLSIFASRF
jgi:hypothetical protein